MKFVGVSHSIQILCYRPVHPFMSDEVTLLQSREGSSDGVRTLCVNTSTGL
jgi:hypothetical protein